MHTNMHLYIPTEMWPPDQRSHSTYMYIYFNLLHYILYTCMYMYNVFIHVHVTAYVLLRAIACVPYVCMHNMQRTCTCQTRHSRMYIITIVDTDW